MSSPGLAPETSVKSSSGVISRSRGARIPVGRVLLLLVVLLAFGLRTFDLDGQSMWNDEGLRVSRAR